MNLQIKTLNKSIWNQKNLNSFAAARRVIQTGKLLSSGFPGSASARTLNDCISPPVSSKPALKNKTLDDNSLNSCIIIIKGKREIVHPGAPNYIHFKLLTIPI